ncbi:tetratricopeptide (TPR) repeat protein [Mycolicibacterium sp. BK556]|uniref:tetratricopeptide repeat protein n=1 Tax=unclassified Mycolicibacterium TaxID=2636767 RepID=UPI001619272D|nr:MULTISPECIES: hypothetical protein [unclassified Mycolicibacterium]MBB3602765.1 tetratricopeptide (TPR) repeat protein [Mycolicibacterium sp. BK556]MBB3632960.1 tetratricopeptide (TPR) repeat protein [Mycolicibacterium sp. BK607]
MDPIDTLRRRLNREPGAAISAVELGAELLVDGLKNSGRTQATFASVDCTDSLTFRLLARAAVRAGCQNRVTFRWTTTCTPTGSCVPPATAAEAARRDLHRRVAAIGIFSIRAEDEVSLPYPGHDPFIALRSTEGDVIKNLAAHNYDAALAISCGDCDTSPPRRERLLAMTHVALGDYQAAEDSLRRAIALDDSDPLHKAHIYCLLALLQIKRYSALDSAELTLQAGLDILNGQTEDARWRVERAWLLNGQALIAALRAKETAGGKLTQAYRLAHDALILVRDVEGDEAAYLRFNLVANLAVLHEMRGDPHAAMATLRRSFDKVQTPLVSRSTAFYEYRMGVLALQAGSLDWVPPGPDLALELEDWPVDDYLTRVTGLWHLYRGESGQAAQCFRRGMKIADASRSAATYIFHARAMEYISGEQTPAQILAALPSKLPTNCAQIDFDYEPDFRIGNRLKRSPL